MMLNRILYILVFIPIALCARKTLEEPLSEATQGPWLTGPLLAPSGYVMPYGHCNYEPYVYCTQKKAHYNDHWRPCSIPSFTHVLLQPTFEFGILPGMEFDFIPQFSYQDTQDKHAWRINDIPLVVAFQLLKEKQGELYPAIKLRFSTIAPLGKFNHLNPDKFGTDAGGFGNWFPSVGLVFTRLLHLEDLHYLSWRFFINSTFPHPVHVSGLSVYGGIPTTKGINGTNGTVYPGNIFTVLQGLEYTLDHNWVFALDVLYLHSNRNRFSGRSPKGTKPTAPSSDQISLAPAIEYNFNVKVGVIAGPWFSIAGRNNSDFISWVFAVNIYQ